MISDLHVAILGLGEAGSRFANDLAALGVSTSGWDPNPMRSLDPSIYFAKDNIDACKHAQIILSVNTSEASESVANEVLPVLNSGKIYAEMNTSSPERKIKIYDAVKSSGVKYVDVAIMAPVPPKGIFTPFLISGPGANALHERLSQFDFDISVLNDIVGDASTRKLLRSIVYKGIAAVICEAVEAGARFELADYVREQISSIIGGKDELIDRFVEGSFTHAERRSHEMDAVVQMLKAKGMDPILSKASYDHLSKLLTQRKM